MSLAITTSPDITLLDFAILYDLSPGVPSITLTNRSVGNPSGTTNLDNCTWWYTIITPSGVYIHQGSVDNPDVTSADWTELVIPEGSWPTPFGVPPYGQVDFSCSVPYNATLYVKDSNDNIFSLSKKVTICRPNGNTDQTKGNYGVAGVTVTVKCDIAKIYANDVTNYTYQNRIGEFDANQWTLAYPMDEAGNIPTPVQVENQGRALFNVGYSAEGYQLYLNTIASYDMGDYQTIKLGYKFKDVFAVLCNINLCSIACEIDKLYAQTNTSCGTVKNPELADKLLRINTLLGQCLIGINQPLCGIDVPAKILEIQEIGGFKCDCGIIGGINPIASTDGSINIELDLTGGITGNVTNSGDNYVIHLAVPGATGTLQQVTDNGNITTRNMISGNTSGAYTIMAPTGMGVYNAGSNFRAGFEMLLGKGYLRMGGATSGVVQWRAADTTSDYTLVMPSAGPSAGQVMVFDGSGNGSFASASGTLQTVTNGVGNNVTTNDMVSGAIAGNNMLMSGAKVALRKSGATDLIWFENASGTPILAIGGDLAGVFRMKAASTTTDYTLTMPATGPAAGEVMIFDAAGNATFGSAAGNLQTVTGVGNSTTIEIISGNVAGNNTSISSLKSGIRAGGTTDLIWFENVAGAPHLKSRAPSSAFLVDVVTPSISSGGNRVIQWPSRANGILALQGNNTPMSYLVGGTGGTSASGTGATLVFDANSDGNKGAFTLTTGTVGSTFGLIVLFGYIDGLIGTVPQPMISPLNAAARALTLDQAYLSNIADGGWGMSNGTPLASSTAYKWNYIIQR